MMLYPSIDELLEKEPSKYSLIILASKRARQMHEFKMMQLNQYKSVKTIGKALEEVNAGLLSVDRS
ncbi:MULTISPECIES: DNA-directed RNA polymerase subunit omega [Facklamia]|uniref:DNA-directed RNA polymerase subunit omega n=2 Tax=Facklamia hominis TaxID=178214 RepID=K1MJT7_9LACT|nr:MULTISPECIES: DNA-directed RNA polymerase subunit omega [Facklamia]EKB56179.1 DNA-directed RNA polymerase, omega subunit [Facklamia hominis CCUG 36813]EPH12969.1 DNA-directed RNA polymerase, omega subunit [Facklamia hominis ACS-120-V-Sch10]MDK7188110.1 DNA-directed RNA polymerase subunit omega [Facklamia hominis]OFL68169.1 DNA-directed RNA polymerase subunit omega [Facklamia sp. HMSC062C11]PKY92790.1 DNA-directed RNA polymerase subunit omega [Facklamia hominis]